LLATWRATDPQLLLIELFPFGRSQMRFELLPLLDAARQSPRPPVMVSSVRDVLSGSQKEPQRQRRMLELFDRYFDHVLVHGDPALVPFERTFAHVPELGARLHYTGYVVDAAAPDDNADDGALDGRDEVLVSAGGGAVGLPLLTAAIHARQLTQLAGARWRVLVGAGVGAAAFADLAALDSSLHGQGVIVERNRAGFPQLLRRCRLSVSQAGYNTVLEVLQAATRAVLVPFAGGTETEQTLRAQLLADRGCVDLVEESALTPAALAQGIDRAAARAPLTLGQVRLDGAATSARLVRGWLSGRSAQRIVPAHWAAFLDEIARWTDAGRVVDLWWRDDDACRADPALTRLVDLSAAAQVPLALAVIPQGVQAAVLVQDARWIRVLQHGADHMQRAAAGEKKNEFPASEPVEAALGRLQAGYARIAGPITLPVLVPPWNRIGSANLPAQLTAVGYRGLSRFGPRASAASVCGLVQVNTHIDVIDWRGTRGFVGEQAALGAATAHLQARREGRADPDEATGWLTHHLMHDAACWAFLERLFDRTRAEPAVAWQCADVLFGVSKAPSPEQASCPAPQRTV
jgi:predicted glycosyltransferase